MKEKKYLYALVVICILEIGIAIYCENKDTQKVVAKANDYDVQSSQIISISADAESMKESMYGEKNISKNEKELVDNTAKDFLEEQKENNDVENKQKNEKEIDDKYKVENEEELYEKYTDVILQEKEEAEEESYFEDAIFIGDSRMYAFEKMSGIQTGAFFAEANLTIEKMETLKAKEKTVYDILKEKQYKKIYIGIGVSELVEKNPENFEKNYSKMIEKIKDVVPNAIIYVLPILNLSEEENSKIYNKDNINSYNSVILSIAREEELNFINTKNAICDEKRNLKEKMSDDGINLNANSCENILEYLKKCINQ